MAAPPQPISQVSLYDRLRRYRTQDALERRIQGTALAGAADALARGVPLGQALQIVPERPLEESPDYEAQIDILGKMAELEKERRLYGEKLAEARGKVMEEQRQQLDILIKNLTTLETNEQSSNASVKSAQINAAGTLSGVALKGVFDGLDPASKGYVDTAVGKILQTPAGQALAYTNTGTNAQGGRVALSDVQMQEFIQALNTEINALTDPNARAALLVNLDDKLGLTGSTNSLVSLVADPSRDPADLYGALTKQSLRPGAVSGADPLFVGTLGSLRASHSTSIRQALNAQDIKIASGQTASDLAGIVQRGGGVSSTNAQDAISILYSLMSGDKPLTSQQMLQAKDAAMAAFRGDPRAGALAQQVAKDIDALPTDEDAEDAARQFSIQHFGYDPKNLDELAKHYQDLLLEMQDTDPRTAYGMQTAIMASPEFQAWQAESGIVDPQEAWRALNKASGRAEQGIREADRAQGTPLSARGADPMIAPAPQPRAATAPATPTPATASADASAEDDEDAFNPYALGKAPASVARKPDEIPQAAMTQALRVNLGAVKGKPVLPQTAADASGVPETPAALGAPGGTPLTGQTAFQGALAASKKDALRRALQAGSNPTTGAPRG